MTKTNVLIVDDEMPFVEAMTKRLSKRGLSIASAFSGHEALAYLATGNPVDVVILDVRMPGMDGLDTLTAIHVQFPNLPVIILTGHATLDTAIKGMRRGAFDYLTKPCELEALIEKIQEAIAGRS